MSPHDKDSIPIDLQTFKEVIEGIAYLKAEMGNVVNMLKMQPCQLVCKNEGRVEALERGTRWIRGVPGRIVAIATVAIGMTFAAFVAAYATHIVESTPSTKAATK